MVFGNQRRAAPRRILEVYSRACTVELCSFSAVSASERLSEMIVC